jgi:molybdate transport system ATP-binding protein
MSVVEFRCRLRYPSGFVLDAEFESDAAITGLFGPSGSGKTSVLSLVAGLRKPDAGVIRVAGRELFNSASGVNLKPDARRIGYVFQGHLLFPHLSVRENLAYGATRRRQRGPTVEFDRLVAALELSELLERAPHTLSGGQRQRVALGRALLSGPQLLLLDEPLASIDEPLRDRLLVFLKRVLDEWQIPTIYVSHDSAEIESLAEHVVHVQNGKIVDGICGQRIVPTGRPG